jgi:hypothetical protein
MPFRDSILAVSPPFLLGPIGTAVQVAEGEIIDALADWETEGVEASMPGIGTPDALYLCGIDMSMDRNPGDTDDHYAFRIQRSVDSHQVQGNGPELLRQLVAWFFPSITTPVRLVSDSAVWHEIDEVTGVVTKTNVGNNWTWDAFTGVRWWRGWVIIDSSVSPWVIDLWGDPGDWGDGGTWGSSATLEQVSQIRRVVEQWKPANIIAKSIIVTFDASLFERTDTAPPNVNGTGEDSVWRAAQDAIFWGGVT